MATFLILLQMVVILYIFALYLNNFAFLLFNFNYKKDILIHKTAHPNKITTTIIRFNFILNIITFKLNKLYPNIDIIKNIKWLKEESKSLDKNLKSIKKLKGDFNYNFLNELAKFIVIKTITHKKTILLKFISTLKHNNNFNKNSIIILNILIKKYLFCVLFKNIIYSKRVHKTIKKYSNPRNRLNLNNNPETHYAIFNHNKNASLYNVNKHLISGFLYRQYSVREVNKLICLCLKAINN